MELNEDLFEFQIGRPGWEATLRSLGESVDPAFWDDCTKVSERALEEFESSVNRMLPFEYREFLKAFGHGTLPFELELTFDDPGETIRHPYSSLYYFTGSLTPGEEWATEEEHQEYYLSRGATNPKPEVFSKKAFTFEGIDLLRLLDVARDEGASLYFVEVDKKDGSGRFFTAHEADIQDVLPSFSEGLKFLFRTDHEIRCDLEELEGE